MKKFDDLNSHGVPPGIHGFFIGFVNGERNGNHDGPRDWSAKKRKLKPLLGSFYLRSLRFDFLRQGSG